MTTKSVFETKEQYLNFRKAWAAAVNDERAKSKIVSCDEHKYVNYIWTRVEGTGRCREKGWINAAHMLLFNLLTGKPFYNGFTSTTNSRKLYHSRLINQGLFDASHGLERIIGYAHQHVQREALPEDVKNKTPYYTHQYRRETLEKFLEPFDGHLTAYQLCQVEVPRVKPVGMWDNSIGEAICVQLMTGEYTDVEDFGKVLERYEYFEEMRKEKYNTLVPNPMNPTRSQITLWDAERPQMTWELRDQITKQ